MQQTTAGAECEILASLFACWGLPKEVISDNKPFKSAAFTAFPCNNGIYPHSYTVYHPASNGAAECTVCNLQSTFLK
jgi:hypothetical protein